MRKLGIAVYPQHSDVDTLKDYVMRAKKHGFERIFTCLMSLKDEQEKMKLQEINAFARAEGFEIIADIAPNVFQELGITYRETHKIVELFHLTGLRLDMGFSGQEEAFLSVQNPPIQVELNISNGTYYVDTVLSYQANSAQIMGCHNFYPKKYTGLSRQHFLKTSSHFKNLGIRTAIMISSQQAKYGPWEETPYGLPTLEDHRFLPLVVQAKDAWQTGFIDDLIIGNMFATEEELETLGKLNRHMLELTVEFTPHATPLEKQIVLNEPHFNRGDVSEYMIRSTQSRVKYKQEEFPKHDVHDLKKGDVTIDHNGDIRYKGELNVILKAHANEGNTNVVARIIPEERYLLDQIQPWTSFCFVEK